VTYDLVTSLDSTSAISSPELPAGLMHSPSLAGLLTVPSGPAVLPANPSAQLARDSRSETSDTSGLSSLTSSAPADRVSSWASRLSQRFAKAGSTEFSATSKPLVTPAGRQLFRLALSERPTAETGCSSWPTPTASEHKYRLQGTSQQSKSLAAIAIRTGRMLGPTDSRSGVTTEGRGGLSPALPCWLMGFPAQWLSVAPSATQSSRQRRQK
jgi:hypothetical protein